MARNGLIPAALLVALVVVPARKAAERNGNNTHCVTECYFDCTQIKIFSKDEFKKECILACSGHAIRKTSKEDCNKFFPWWI